MEENHETTLLRAAYAGASEPALLPLEEIRLDWSVHPREKLHERYVQRFIYAIENGDLPPPVTVFRMEVGDILVDGFYRFEACRRVGATTIECIVIPCSRYQAVAHAIEVNAQHGLKLNNAEKRTAIGTMLEDPDNHHLSNSELARKCGCSHTTVARVRRALGFTCTSADGGVRQVRNKHGTRGPMKIGKIGRSQSRRTDPDVSTTAPVDIHQSDEIAEDDPSPRTPKAAREVQQTVAQDEPDPGIVTRILDHIDAVAAADPTTFALAVFTSPAPNAQRRFEAIFDWCIRSGKFYFEERNRRVGSSASANDRDQ